MTAYRRKGAQVQKGPKAGLRQTGQFDWHPDECGCRKCRRARAATARRSTAATDALGRPIRTTGKDTADG